MENSSLPSNISQDVDSAMKFFETSKFINGLILYPVICIPGLVGNIMTIIVLSMKNMLTSTNAFLSALAVSDAIKLTNDVVYFSVLLLFKTNDEAANIAFVHIYPYAHFIFNIAACVSSWLIVSVAVERFIMVCYPTQAREICTRRRAIIICVIVFIVMFSISLPYSMRYRTIKERDSVTNETVTKIVTTDLWQNERFKNCYTWVISFLRCNIPLVILIILNACIIYSMRKTRAKRKQTKRNRVTFMMIIVIMVFMICITPDAVMSAFFGYGYYEVEDYYVKGIREFSDTLLALNAAVNFIIYCVLGQTFRKNFLMLFCPCVKQQNRNMGQREYRCCARFSEPPRFWTLFKKQNQQAQTL